MGRKRDGISKSVRFEVFKRDGFCCQYCGAHPPKVILNLDHIVAHSKGGADDPGNLITSCEACNLGKSDRDLDCVPQSLKDQIEDKRIRAEQVQAYNSFLMELRDGEDAVIRNIGRLWYNEICAENDAFVFGLKRSESIRTFLKSLPPAEIIEAVGIALSKVRVYGDNDEKAWKYFCGVCWRKIERF